MEIIVAGAGAGKTTSMAARIIEEREKLNNDKMIFCITFTNNAVTCIKEKLEEYYVIIPDNIKVSTIHSFFNQEFIKPYYYLLYGIQFEDISTSVLPTKNHAEKYSLISWYEDHNVLHQTRIPKIAKYIASGKSDDKKDIKEKRKNIMKIFQAYCGEVFVDEAQDIDNDMLNIIESIDDYNIQILLSGDPKQDLKGTGVFSELIKDNPDKTKYNNECYRCPKKHLELSNSLVDDKQQQTSKKTTGSIYVKFSSEEDIYKLISENNYDLKYISRKKGIFETHGVKDTHSYIEDVCNAVFPLIKNKLPNDSKVDLDKKTYIFSDILINKYIETRDAKKVVNEYSKYIGMKKQKSTIIKLLSEYPIDKNKDVNNNKIYVNSIDSIKGQEGENCLFILTNDLAAYLFKDKNEDNKTKNKLYVALTRSLDKLTIFITEEVEEKYDKEKIKDFFKKYN